MSRPWKKFWPWRIGNKSDNATDSTPRIHTVARLGLIKEGVCFRFFGCLQDEGRNCSKCCTVMTGFTPLKIQNPRSCFKRCYLASLDHFLKKSFPLLSTTSTKNHHEASVNTQNLLMITLDSTMRQGRQRLENLQLQSSKQPPRHARQHVAAIVSLCNSHCRATSIPSSSMSRTSTCKKSIPCVFKSAKNQIARSFSS